MPTEISVEKVRHIIAEVLEVSPGQIDGHTHFIHSLGADSLRVIEILARLESELGVAIDQSELARMVSLDAVCEVARAASVEA